MPEWLLFVLAVFACFRLAELAVVDNGPFDVFKRFRAWVGVYDLDENGEPYTNAGKLFACPYCMGVYFALLLTLIIAPFDWRLVLCWFGIAGGQAFLQSIGGRNA